MNKIQGIRDHMRKGEEMKVNAEDKISYLVKKDKRKYKEKNCKMENLENV